MNDICRVCFIRGEVFSLFESSDPIKLSVKMMSCASVKVVRGDKYPPGICKRCVERLNISYDFRVQCEKSEGWLRDNLEDIVVKRESDCDDEPLRLNKIKKKTDRPLKNKRLKVSNRPKRQRAAIKIVDEVENEMEENSRGDGEYKSSGETEIPVGSAAIQNIEESSGNVANVGITRQKKTVDEKGEKPVKGPSHSKQQCVTCGRVMSSRYRLQMHMRTHTGEKPHKCQECGKCFSLAQSLRIHVRTHTGEKPLKCPICGKLFAQAAGLSSHKRLHTGELPYPCHLCPMSFRTTAHRQYHISKHKGERSFECVMCARAFFTRGDLKQHALIHTGERPFVCTVCGARMARSSHIKRHMMTHTGEKPHKCDICGSSYAQRGDLVRHTKTHMATHHRPPLAYVRIQGVTDRYESCPDTDSKLDIKVDKETVIINQPVDASSPFQNIGNHVT